jgi:hypothetical protein
VAGKDVGLILGTLMSGHRCTTFFNTILNEAYIRYAYDGLDELQSMHVGDDVYISAPDYATAQRVLHKCADAGLAMNPLKQSVGIYCAEFLRVAYGSDCARGYVPRSIATCVNGNWVSDVQLNAEQGLKSIIGHAWTLCNRAMNPSVGALLVSSVKRMCKLSSKVARDLLTGAAGLKDGPTRATGLWVRSYELQIDVDREAEEVALASHGLGEHATIDYLTHCATPLEQYVLGQIGGDIKDTMRCASYRKTMISGSADARVEPSEVRKVRYTTRKARGSVRMESAGWNVEQGGWLARFPLLQLKHRIKGELLAQALVSVGAPIWYGVEAEMMAWGRRAQSLAIHGTLSYADASALCNKVEEDMVQVMYNCFA